VSGITAWGTSTWGDPLGKSVQFAPKQACRCGHGGCRVVLLSQKRRRPKLAMGPPTGGSSRVRAIARAAGAGQWSSNRADGGPRRAAHGRLNRRGERGEKHSGNQAHKASPGAEIGCRPLLRKKHGVVLRPRTLARANDSGSRGRGTTCCGRHVLMAVAGTHKFVGPLFQGTKTQPRWGSDRIDAVAADTLGARTGDRWDQHFQP